jgi:hypothetical protein
VVRFSPKDCFPPHALTWTCDENAATAVESGDRSDHVRRLDLRSPPAACSRSEGGAPTDAGSAAGRAAIVRAAKKRWAKVRRQAKKTTGSLISVVRCKWNAKVLLQLCVFDLGLLQDGNVGVGVFPEGEEILVSSASCCRIARERLCAAQS